MAEPQHGTALRPLRNAKQRVGDRPTALEAHRPAPTDVQLNAETACVLYAPRRVPELTRQAKANSAAANEFGEATPVLASGGLIVPCAQGGEAVEHHGLELPGPSIVP